MLSYRKLLWKKIADSVFFLSSGRQLSMLYTFQFLLDEHDKTILNELCVYLNYTHMYKIIGKKIINLKNYNHFFYDTIAKSNSTKNFWVKKHKIIV